MGIFKEYYLPFQARLAGRPSRSDQHPTDASDAQLSIPPAEFPAKVAQAEPAPDELVSVPITFQHESPSAAGAQQQHGRQGSCEPQSAHSRREQEMPQGVRHGAPGAVVHAMQVEEGLQPFRRLNCSRDAPLLVITHRSQIYPKVQRLFR